MAWYTLPKEFMSTQQESHTCQCCTKWVPFLCHLLLVYKCGGYGIEKDLTPLPPANEEMDIQGYVCMYMYLSTLDGIGAKDTCAILSLLFCTLGSAP